MPQRCEALLRDLSKYGRGFARGGGNVAIEATYAPPNRVQVAPVPHLEPFGTLVFLRESE